MTEGGWRLETIVENLIQVAGPAEVRSSTRSYRAVSIIAAIALVLGGVVLARSASSSAPKTSVVSNIDHGHAVIDGTGAVLGRTLGFGAVQPQIDTSALIRSIVCPILNSLATGPFASFIGPIINSLRAAFGCTSG